MWLPDLRSGLSREYREYSTKEKSALGKQQMKGQRNHPLNLFRWIREGRRGGENGSRFPTPTPGSSALQPPPLRSLRSLSSRSDASLRTPSPPPPPQAMSGIRHPTPMAVRKFRIARLRRSSAKWPRSLNRSLPLSVSFRTSAWDLLGRFLERYILPRLGLAPMPPAVGGRLVVRSLGVLSDESVHRLQPAEPRGKAFICWLVSSPASGMASGCAGISCERISRPPTPSAPST